MALAELQRPITKEAQTDERLAPFESELCRSLRLLPEQLNEEGITFDEKVANIFNPEEFLEEDDHTSRHYLANKVTDAWALNDISLLKPSRISNPAESYTSFLLRVTPIVEKAYPDREQENPGKISYTIIQGLIQTEMSLREKYNETHNGNLYSLPISARNTMFFSLSDALISYEGEQDTSTLNSDGILLEEGREQDVNPCI